MRRANNLAIGQSVLSRSKEDLTAASIPIPDDLFGHIKDTSTRTPSPDPKIQISSTPDRLCSYIDVRRQFAPAKVSLFGGGAGGGSITAAPALVAGRQLDATSARASGLQTNRRDLTDPVRSDSLDDSASIISVATTASTASISTKATTTGSSTSLPAIAPKSSGLWAAARNAIPALGRPVAVKEQFYCVLKGATIYLYDDERQSDPVHVIAVDQYHVKVHTKLGEFQGRDGEMFNKKHAIVLHHHALDPREDDLPGAPMSRKNTPTSKQDLLDEDHEPWFLSIRNHSE